MTRMLHSTSVMNRAKSIASKKWHISVPLCQKQPSSANDLLFSPRLHKIWSADSSSWWGSMAHLSSEPQASMLVPEKRRGKACRASYGCGSKANLALLLPCPYPTLLHEPLPLSIWQQHHPICSALTTATGNKPSGGSDSVIYWPYLVALADFITSLAW